MAKALLKDMAGHDSHGVNHLLGLSLLNCEGQIVGPDHLHISRKLRLLLRWMLNVDRGTYWWVWPLKNLLKGALYFLRDPLEDETEENVSKAVPRPGSGRRLSKVSTGRRGKPRTMQQLLHHQLLMRRRARFL